MLESQYPFLHDLENDKLLILSGAWRTVESMSAVPRLLAAARLAAVVGVSAAGVVVLHRVGARPYFRVEWSDLGGWLEVTPPEDALVAALRLAGLVVAWWVLVTSLLYVAARAARLPAAVRAVQWAVLPPVRRLADRAVAGTLVGSSVLGAPAQALAAEHDPPLPPPVVVQADEDAEGDAESWYVPTPAGPGGGDAQPGGHVGTDGWRSNAEALVVGRGDRPHAETQERARDAAAHTVVAGDHLWGIAEARLRAAWEREPTEAETAAYWREVIAANRARLVSGDPDLVFPGEVIELPEVPPPPEREE